MHAEYALAEGPEDKSFQQQGTNPYPSPGDLVSVVKKKNWIWASVKIRSNCLVEDMFAFEKHVLQTLNLDEKSSWNDVKLVMGQVY